VLWCGKKKPSIKEEIEQAKGRLSKEQYKAAESNYKRMAEHVDKLEKYKQNPLKYDNLGLLKNAPTFNLSDWRGDLLRNDARNLGHLINRSNKVLSPERRG